jgi:acetylornithine/succinyldiaminopimelate/putrescine aminotransferase
LKSKYAATVNPHWLDAVSAMGTDITFTSARGCYLIDDTGREFLDFVGGFGAAAVGHNHPHVTDALECALRDGVPELLPLGVVREAGDLGARLVQLTESNGRLSKVYFANTGSEAVDAALKFATARTGRTQFVSFAGDFHGLSIGATPLAGGGEWHVPFPACGPTVHHVEVGNLAAVERVLARGAIAAVVLEVVQGSAGAQAWDPGGLSELAALCDRYGTLVVADEVLTGLGRTGRWFAFQHAPGFLPDLVLVSKALTGGRFPVSAVLMGDATFEAAFGRAGHARVHSATFSEHRLAMICGLAALEVIEAEGLVERADRVGERLLRTLTGMREAGLIADVRGLGLLAAFRVGERPGLDAPSAMALCWQGLLERGVLTLPAAHQPDFIKLTPPLTVSDDDVDDFIAALSAALEKI